MTKLSSAIAWEATDWLVPLPHRSWAASSRLLTPRWAGTSPWKALGPGDETLREIITGFLNEVRFD
jgi:hypothetical protein